MPELTLSIWILSIVCAIMIGMAKTGINGLGTLVVPLMAFAFGGMPSSGLVLPMLIMADVFGVFYYHRNAHFKTLIKIMPWALVGIIAGLVTGKAISAEQFKHLIGVLLILSLVVMVWSEYSLKKSSRTNQKSWFAIPFGVAGGFSTMIGNAAGPVMSIYLLMKNLPKNQFIGTAAWFFFVVNLIKLPLQIWGWHNITPETLFFNFKMLPFIALGAFLGIRLVRLIPEKIYRWVILIGTLVSSLGLLIL